MSALLALALTTGCATTIVQPPSPRQPVEVFILDHGRTTSLVLPTAEGRMTRYAYGDWAWYALGMTSIADGLRALVGPTPSTFGRQELSGPPRADTLRKHFPAAFIVNLHTVTVGRDDVERLRMRLDAEHRRGRDIALVQTADLEFVPDPRPYSYFHNSNHVVAEWLRELGCETRGPGLNSQWRITSR